MTRRPKAGRAPSRKASASKTALSASSASRRLRTNRLSWSETAGEIVVLDLSTSTYLAIKGSGAVLWRALAEGSTFVRLTELLVETYRIDTARARSDVAEFVDELTARGWLEAAT
jgi:Coenzyme PQQ synthesis protein D (PqqD)